jgi:ribosomal protein S10
MKKYNLIIASKSKNLLKRFLIFLFKYCKSNFSYLNKKFYKKTKKKVFTILKSPHVNKKAQEQFGIQTFFMEFTFNVNTNFIFLMCLKKLKLYLFPNIHIKVKTFIIKPKNNILNLFNSSNYINLKKLEIKKSNNIYLRKIKKKIKITNDKDQNIISILDLYGSLQNI